MSLKLFTIVAWFGLGLSIASYLALLVVGLGDYGGALILGVFIGSPLGAFALGFGLLLNRSRRADPWRRRALLTLGVTLVPGGALFAWFAYAIIHLPVH
jgi:hypothetical protein